MVGIDLTPMAPIPGAELIELDFLDPEAPAKLKAALGGPADVVLSDMAAPATGHARTDHIKIIALAEAAHAFATEVLKPGGAFIAKVLQGGATQELLAAAQARFRRGAPCEARGEPGRFGGDLCRGLALPRAGRRAGLSRGRPKRDMPALASGASCV